MKTTYFLITALTVLLGLQIANAKDISCKTISCFGQESFEMKEDSKNYNFKLILNARNLQPVFTKVFKKPETWAVYMLEFSVAKDMCKMAPANDVVFYCGDTRDLELKLTNVSTKEESKATVSYGHINNEFISKYGFYAYDWNKNEKINLTFSTTNLNATKTGYTYEGFEFSFQPSECKN